jgi:hypothetical protein
MVLAFMGWRGTHLSIAMIKVNVEREVDKEKMLVYERKDS